MKTYLFLFKYKIIIVSKMQNGETFCMQNVWTSTELQLSKSYTNARSGFVLKIVDNLSYLCHSEKIYRNITGSTCLFKILWSDTGEKSSLLSSYNTFKLLFSSKMFTSI